MALQPFTWGANGQRATPSSVKRQAEIAAALAARGGAPQNVGEGLNRIGEALLANSYSARAAAGEEEGAAARKAVMDALMGNADPTMADIAGAMGNEWVTSDPGSSAVLQALMGAEIQQNDPLRQQQLAMGELELDALRNPKPDYGFIELPDGSIVRTDSTSGGVESMGQFGTPPAPDAPTLKTIFDPATGREQTVQWNGTDWEPIGGVQAPKEPMVQVNTGAMGPKLGSLSTDYGYVLDPTTGEARIDPATGLPTAAPVPGSPAARELQAASDAAALADERTDLKGGVVVQDIDRALQSITDNPTMTTGIGSAVTGSIPSTPAYNVNALIDTVKANAGFAELQAMRESSPTGGALGNVTEKEIAYLQATIGNLDPRQSPEQLADNLKRVKNAYLDIIHGPGSGPPREPLSFEAQSGEDIGPPPEGLSPEEWQFLTPEERALWQN